MIAKGKLGSVEFDGEWVTIQRSAMSPTGRVHKRVHIRDIGPIQLKPATLVTNGFIKFDLPGNVALRSRFGAQGVRTMYDENAVAFARRHEQAFTELVQAIEAAVAKIKR